MTRDDLRHRLGEIAQKAYEQGMLFEAGLRTLENRNKCEFFFKLCGDAKSEKEDLIEALLDEIQTGVKR